MDAKRLAKVRVQPRGLRLRRGGGVLGETHDRRTPGSDKGCSLPVIVPGHGVAVVHPYSLDWRETIPFVTQSVLQGDLRRRLGSFRDPENLVREQGVQLNFRRLACSPLINFPAHLLLISNHNAADWIIIVVVVENGKHGGEFDPLKLDPFPRFGILGFLRSPARPSRHAASSCRRRRNKYKGGSG